jgi:VWFA-related protein
MMARRAGSRHSLPTCLLAASLALANTALAQQTAPASAPGKEDTSAKATLAFLAVNQDGHPVKNLQAQELSLRIDDQPRRVLSLEPTNEGPRTIGIFFDTSGSRYFDKLIANEAEETSKFLGSIWNAYNDGFVVVFNNEAHTLAKATPDLQQIQATLQGVPREAPRGGTALYDSLCSVRFGQSSRDIERVFLVVSDFEDNLSRISKEKTIQIMQEEGVRIVVLLADPEDARFRYQSNPLHGRAMATEVARQTGGDVFVVTKQQDLAAAFQKLEDELQGSYRVTYEPLPATAKPAKQQLRTTRPNVRLLYANRN